MSSSTALITGASGFLGTYLAEACAKAGLRVVGFGRTLPSNPNIYSDFICGDLATNEAIGKCEGLAPEYCFHLAGPSSVPASMNNPVDDFSGLLPGTQRILDFVARRSKPCHFVLFSSAAVYGNPRTLPVNESMDLRPVSPYGIHKATAESLTFHYARFAGFAITVLRIFSAYGPGLHRQIVWDAFGKLIEASARGERAVFFGTGCETRDFIHATDVVRLAMKVIKYPAPYAEGIFNAAVGKEVAIGDIVKMIARRIPGNPEFVFNGSSRRGDPDRWCADVSKISKLDFSPIIDLAEGISSTIDSYLKARLANTAQPDPGCGPFASQIL